MALIDFVKKEEATGKIAEMYQLLEQRMQILPNVIQFNTASPELFEKMMSFWQHYMDHPHFDSQLVAWIRLLISHAEGGTYCVRFQSSILGYLGVQGEELSAALQDYHKLPLEQKRRDLVAFVVDVLLGNHKDTEVQLAHLRSHGWTDQDIYEASVLGALQKGMVQVVKAFQVEIDF